MDVKHFADLRANFIRMFYKEGRKPFDTIQKAIDEQAPPFDEPPYGYDIESGEPAYLTEWLEAEMAINVLGYSCLAMLSNSLKIAFTNFENVFGFKPGKSAFKQGLVAGYRGALSEVLSTDWSDCPADFAIIEQVVLARNSTQHMDDYSGFDAYHDENTIRKNPSLFFAGGKETLDPNDPVSWFGRRIEVTEADLLRAIDEVEKLVAYVAGREDKAYEWRKSRRHKG
ncbi:hypothetical protein ACC764_08560 [Rhizobium ruizarguesonis]|uniref:hypothetical protein n=1 Tax=Rhizobium ruizarguesonis TaxID=2081791 RepID=UPI0010323689|nr:hypothetical protein [Rhizobium ruizarguesonis]TBC98787.1 hypothetical protein ELH25_08840 [Rhizobium ruizarguesonis]TBD15622.1 hypothetical protein ELH24_08795 [Rhizobium ruizarguesonis]TBE96653.1 hypothetical protein ELG98_08650 [Rhizobium ruizarguesonis]